MKQQDVFRDGFGFAHFLAPRDEIGEQRVSGPAQPFSARNEPVNDENRECLAYNKDGEHKRIREMDMLDFNKIGWFSSPKEAADAFESLKSTEKSLEKKKKELTNSPAKSA